MADLKVVLWNCGGLRANTASTLQKMGTFDKSLPNASFDIAAFVETHHRDESDFPDLIKEYKISHFCLHTPATPVDKYAGIVVLIRKNICVIWEESLNKK